MSPIDLETGWDFTRATDRRRVYDLVEKEKPDLIVAAWPCTSYSTLQNLANGRRGHHERLRRLRRQHDQLVEFSRKVCRMQQTNGRDFIGENPLTSKVWTENDAGK